MTAADLTRGKYYAESIMRKVLPQYYRTLAVRNSHYDNFQFESYAKVKCADVLYSQFTVLTVEIYLDTMNKQLQ
jgi:hypothetical protein